MPVILTISWVLGANLAPWTCFDSSSDPIHCTVILIPYFQGSKNILNLKICEARG